MWTADGRVLRGDDRGRFDLRVARGAIARIDRSIANERSGWYRFGPYRHDAPAVLCEYAEWFRRSEYAWPHGNEKRHYIVMIDALN